MAQVNEQLQLPLGVGPDRIVQFRGRCAVCGKEIVNVEYPTRHLIESDYQDEKGRCFSCNGKARKTRGGK